MHKKYYALLLMGLNAVCCASQNRADRAAVIASYIKPMYPTELKHQEIKNLTQEVNNRHRFVPIEDESHSRVQVKKLIEKKKKEDHEIEAIFVRYYGRIVSVALVAKPKL